MLFAVSIDKQDGSRITGVGVKPSFLWMIVSTLLAASTSRAVR
jgi:hypothetical protein